MKLSLKEGFGTKVYKLYDVIAYAYDMCRCWGEKKANATDKTVS
jgi:hypothetical protein